MNFVPCLAFGWLALIVVLVPAADPLPSWNDSAAKRELVSFVQRVTDEESPQFVPPAERIATFDNDGTLWCEQPLYVQAFFALDRVRQLAPQHPEWRTTEPFAAVLRGDIDAALAGGEKSLLQLVMATHAGMTTDEFSQLAGDWIRDSRHPDTNRPFIEMVYQPMLELLDYLRDHGFKNFIVSGGGIDFMRPWTEARYGIPPEQVVGSSVKTRFEVRDGTPVIIRLPEMNFVDDKAGKPVGIHTHVGRRPILAVGNSDGDFEMLQWVTAGSGPRLAVYIHHTDAEREYAYDRQAKIGRLDRGLDEGKRLGWTFVDMKQDWNRVFPDAGGDDTDTDPNLFGNWLAEDILGRGVVDRAQSSLQIAEGGQVTGSTAVNRFSGQAEIKGNRLMFGPLAMTRRAGPPALMEQESRYTQALGKVRSYRLDQAGKLELLDEQGETLIRFSRLAE